MVSPLDRLDDRLMTLATKSVVRQRQDLSGCIMFIVVITPTTRQVSAVRLVERIPSSTGALRAGCDAKVAAFEIVHGGLLESRINREAEGDGTNSWPTMFQHATQSNSSWRAPRSQVLRPSSKAEPSHELPPPHGSKVTGPANLWRSLVRMRARHILAGSMVVRVKSRI